MKNSLKAVVAPLKWARYFLLPFALFQSAYLEAAEDYSDLSSTIGHMNYPVIYTWDGGDTGIWNFDQSANWLDQNDNEIPWQGSRDNLAPAIFPTYTSIPDPFSVDRRIDIHDDMYVNHLFIHNGEGEEGYSFRGLDNQTLQFGQMYVTGVSPLGQSLL